jgi:hypothetical protein
MPITASHFQQFDRATGFLLPPSLGPRPTRSAALAGARAALYSGHDLVNGSSITAHSAVEHSEVECLHVRLAQHDVIFAEGAPSETLLVHSSNVERFDNFAEYLRRFGKDEADEVRCAPIAFASGRERLMAPLRSAVSPWVDCRNEFDKARDRMASRRYLATMRAARATPVPRGIVFRPFPERRTAWLMNG